jgi:hypothetical protein
MAKPYIFGERSPFMEWMSGFKERNPDESDFTCQGIDLLLHLYECVIEDTQARQSETTRQLKAIMGLEVKTCGDDVSFDQRQALWHFHLSMRDVKPDPEHKRSYTIRSFGWSFLRLSSTTPDDSDVITWGRFDEFGVIKWRQISLEMLNDLIAFIRHPDSLKLQPFHRHHGSRSIFRMEAQPLGFEVPIIDVEKY